MGLLLSTPLTVCIIVIGRHIPRLTFINTLLSDEKNFTLYEEFYHHLVSLEFTEAIVLINNYLKKYSLIELYDSIILPMLNAAETDRKKDLLEENQAIALYQNIKIIVDDIFLQTINANEEVYYKNYNILCLPAFSKCDEIAATMLMQVLIKSYFKAKITIYSKNKLIEFIEKENFDLICISAIPSNLIIPIQNIVRNLHQQFPNLKIIIGLWSTIKTNTDIENKLYKAGTDLIIFSLNDARTEIEKFYKLKSK